MRIMYIDTSSSFLHCSLVDNNYLVFSIDEKLEKKMAEDTLFLISNKFQENNILPESIDKFILVNGPGSFTGVRIAITIVKTFAWAFSIPVIVISSLESMAISTKKIDYDYYIPLIDARRGYVYSGIYDKNNNVIYKDRYIYLDDLLNIIKGLNGSYLFISNNNFSFEEKIQEYHPDYLEIVNYCQNMSPITDIHCLSANYLKLTEAEEKNSD